MSFVYESVYPRLTGDQAGPSEEDNAQHQAVGAWFLGPQAENFDWFKSCISSVIDQQRRARTSYYPTDGKFITAAMKDSPTYLGQVAKLENYADRLSDLLNKHSIPFWSARYSAHMTCDTSMPAILGYLMTMLFNPNNVALEASPITTLLEMMVGEQLCSMLRFNLNPEDPGKLPVAWGHITCDGTVANLESIWAARNLKFYPLSLKKAMCKELSFISDSFKVETCKGGEPTLFDGLRTWDLLNLKVSTILDIPDRLQKEYGVSPKFLQDVLKKYSIQSVGKDALEKEFKIDQPIQYMVSATKHYSWPKGAAITGIGSENVVNVRVDNGARLDAIQLEEFLQKRLDREQAVYAVVAIIGTTEEGAVDPIDKVLELRDKFQTRGMSFVVHADAAWGGYFASTLPPKHDDKFRDAPGDYVAKLPLRPNTTNQLLHLHLADSITIDPHKTGYIPYPAGALCYRDNRMKYLVTWTTPYISRDPTAESIGVYGVEGSKPGAAAGATFLSHKVIGLNENGYGGLLSETVFTCSRLSAHWATMDNEDFIVVPLNTLPSEDAEGSTPEMVEQEKQDIRDLILNKNNWEVSQNPKAMKLLGGLGSDLIVNAFACNFRLPDGTLNDDVEEANNLNRRIVNRLSVTSPNKLPSEVPFFLTSTEFLQHEYGDCATNFKRRLGLKGDTDLFVLRNVTMSPFPTEKNFISKLAKIFEKVAKEEVAYCRKRVSVDATDHSFIMQGTNNLHLAYKPLFFEADNRQQLIITANIPSEAMKTYVEARESNPETPFILKARQVKLPDILEKGTFTAEINFGDGTNLVKTVEVTGVNILKQRDLRAIYRDPSYPEGYMPFYVYGTPEQAHIDHMLLHTPNIQLSADNITFDPPLTNLKDDLKKGAILYLKNVSEVSMQPFDLTPSAAELKESNFFFRQGKTFNVSIYKDPKAAVAVGPGLSKVDTEPIATGKMTLTDNVYVDKEWVNSDPFAIKEVTEGLKSWKDKIDKEFP